VIWAARPYLIQACLMSNPETAAGNRILVVDDEEGMRHMLRALLTRRDFVVTEAESGEDALERLSEGDIDIVLADVRMKPLDGLGLLKKLRESKSPVTVIMMSAFVDLDTAIEALKQGAADYVSKPFKADEVFLKIRMAQERARLQEERESLRAENARLKGQTVIADAPAGIVGKSQRMADIFNTIAKIADYKSTALLIGESGTGKELVARALHERSVRAKGPFVPINCGAIPVTLLESELFGHVKGAFTGAAESRAGFFQTADGGTIFLDEIGETSLAMQVKLLRVLQDREIRMVGSSSPRTVDVRVIAATNKDLRGLVKTGALREDLFFRLNVLSISVPALRERGDDVILLARHFLEKFAR